VTEEKKKEIALTFLTALQIRNAAELRSVLTDDAVWSLPGTSAVGGEAKGAEAVVAKGQFLGSHGVDFALLHVLYGWTDVAIMLHNTGQHGDKILDEYLTSVLSLRGEKIQRIDTYISDVPMLDRFAGA
jgi:uncharacterized protein